MTCAYPPANMSMSATSVDGFFRKTTLEIPIEMITAAVSHVVCLGSLVDPPKQQHSCSPYLLCVCSGDSLRVSYMVPSQTLCDASSGIKRCRRWTRRVLARAWEIFVERETRMGIHDTMTLCDFLCKSSRRMLLY